MRSRVALLAMMFGAGLMAGCQGGSDAERQALIDQGIKSCVDGFSRSGGGAGSGIDGQRMCECAIGKMTEGKSLEEVRTIAKQSQPSADDLQKMGACLVEEAQRKGVLSK